MSRLLLVGNGKWAQNYIRASRDVNVDIGVATYGWKDALSSEKYDGVIVCTPPRSHVDIAVEAMREYRLPVAIEKPLSLSLSDAERLIPYSDLVLVNFLHLFAPAFNRLKQIADRDGIETIASAGTNLGPYRDYPALLDYGSHDFAMAAYLTGCFSPKLASISESQDSGNYFLEVDYDDVHHSMTSGNGGPIKRRSFEITTRLQDRIMYDDETREKLFVNGVPEPVEPIPPLQASLRAFRDFVESGVRDSRFGVDVGLATMRIYEQCRTRAGF